MVSIKKRMIVWVAVMIFVLMIPLSLMVLSDEVNWDLFDFFIMGAVILAVGLSYELVARKSGKSVYRLAEGTGLLGAFLLFWVNGAVGIIGHEGQSANLLYGAVFAVGLAGALMARFNPRGMANTFVVAALVQMLVPVIALIIWPPPIISWAPSVFGVFILTAFFAGLFLISAFLFKRAAPNDNLTL